MRQTKQTKKNKKKKKSSVRGCSGIGTKKQKIKIYFFFILLYLIKIDSINNINKTHSLMAKVILLGAINKNTREYVYPKVANKKDEYVCPDCNKDLILCQGDIRAHHFRHKVDSVNPCHHYSNPSESQIHKDAKKLLKNLLERKIPISFIRNCCCCKKNVGWMQNKMKIK